MEIKEFIYLVQKAIDETYILTPEIEIHLRYYVSLESL